MLSYQQLEPLRCNSKQDFFHELWMQNNIKQQFLKIVSNDNTNPNKFSF